MCYVKKHNKHECTDIKEAAEKFNEQLKHDIEIAVKYAIKSQEEIQQIEMNRSSFIEAVAATQIKISQRYDQLLSLIQSHQSHLLDELNVFKEKRLNELEINKEDVEKQFVIMESFKRYCQEMKENGTVCDISRSASDLHARAEELVKIQEGYNGCRLCDVAIVFTPSHATAANATNQIGKLIFTG